jgi:hypothetical protein
MGQRAQKRHKTALAASCAFRWVERTRPLLLAGQGEQAAINLLEPRVFGLDIDLAKDRGIERGVGCCAAWACPQAFDLHRFDHRFAIHRLFRFGQHRNRSFDLAHLLIRWFRFLGGRLGDRGVLLGRFGVVALLAALALRLVLVAVLVAMFVFPCFEICVSRWRRWSHSYV